MPLNMSTNAMLYSLPPITIVTVVITTVSVLWGFGKKANANVKIPDG
jgi:hypothetical protein